MPGLEAGDFELQGVVAVFEAFVEGLEAFKELAVVLDDLLGFERVLSLQTDHLVQGLELISVVGVAELAPGGEFGGLPEFVLAEVELVLLLVEDLRLGLVGEL